MHILHCCKHCVKQFKGTFRSIARVKLPATLNIQLEYVFYTWGNEQSLWVPLSCHQVPVYYFSLETLSAAIKTVVSAY